MNHEGGSHQEDFEDSDKDQRGRVIVSRNKLECFPARNGCLKRSLGTGNMIYIDILDSKRLF